MTESQIQRAILDWLRYRGIFAWRCHIGGVKRSGKGYTRNPMKGFPDIMGVHPDHPGKMFTIEVKTPKGKLSEDQKQWMRKLESAGVLCIVARCVKDVVQAFHPQ